jgi:hypothetical protein
MSALAEPVDSLTISTLPRQLGAAAIHCRDRREEMSLLIVEPNCGETRLSLSSQAVNFQAKRALEIACAALDPDKLLMISLSDRRTAAIIFNCERRAALAVAKNAIAEYAKISEPHLESIGSLTSTMSVGVATASVVPKNFDSGRMIECAARCLSAAQLCGISAVKSIEV